MATYQFGVVSFASTSLTRYGLAQSFSESETVDVVTAPDADGDAADVKAYNRNSTYSMAVILDTSQALPAAGTELSVAASVSGNALITGIDREESNTDYKRATINLQRWHTNAVPTT